MKEKNNLSRRSFLKTSAMAGALGAIGTGSTTVLTSCSGGSNEAANKPLKEPGTYYIPAHRRSHYRVYALSRSPHLPVYAYPHTYP